MRTSRLWIRRTAVVALGVATFTLAWAELPRPDDPRDDGASVRDSLEMADLSLLRSVYSESLRPPGAETCSMKYSVTTARASGNDVDTLSTEVDYAASAIAMRMLSRELIVIRDSLTSTMIVPSRRAIYVASVAPGTRPADAELLSGSAADTFLATSHVVRRTRQVNADSTAVESFVLAPRHVVGNRLGIRLLHITLDRQRRRLISVRVDFLSGVTTFAEVRFGERTCGPAAELALGDLELDHVLDAKGRPVGAFRGFTVVDQRHRR